MASSFTTNRSSSQKNDFLMTFISPNNLSKEWIVRQLAARSADGAFQVCDLACGSGSVWYAFLKKYPNVTYVGLDTDKKAVATAQKKFADLPNATFRVADAQTLKGDEGRFDVVTTFSALEHVVRIDKFLDTVFALLKPQGMAYLNYDNGHFRSSNPKERVMVPVSQILAKFGFEGPYMKEVNDADVVRWITERKGTVERIMKHNIPALKAVAKKLSSDDALEAWLTFENRLNEVEQPDRLNAIMGSTTVVMKNV